MAHLWRLPHTQPLTNASRILLREAYPIKAKISLSPNDPGVLNISIADDEYHAIQEDFKALNQQRR